MFILTKYGNARSRCWMGNKPTTTCKFQVLSVVEERLPDAMQDGRYHVGNHWKLLILHEEQNYFGMVMHFVILHLFLEWLIRWCVSVRQLCTAGKLLMHGEVKSPYYWTRFSTSDRWRWQVRPHYIWKGLEISDMFHITDFIVSLILIYSL